MSPDQATDAANSPRVSGWAKSLPVKRTICPESTAAWTRSAARLNVSSLTEAGSSPFASITRPTESASSISIETLPLSFGSSRSCSIDSTGPVRSSFHAIPVIPDCQGSEYSRSGSNGGLACASMRFSMFGISSLSSFCTHSCSMSSPGKRELSVNTKMSRSIPWPCESGPCTFAKYSALSLISSKYSTVMPVSSVNWSSVGRAFVASSTSM